jgi:hypothetical protein
LSNELSVIVDLLVLTYFIGGYFFEEPEALSYEIFM